MAAELSLRSAHQRLGATFGDVDGRPAPRHYGDPAAEHKAVRERSGLMDRVTPGVIEATGRDRAAFLHGMLTNDIKGLAPGQGCQAAFLDVHGKMVSLLEVQCLPDRLLLVMERALTAPTLAALEHYHFSERVDLEDASDREGLLTLAGPAARRVLEEVLGRPVPALPLHHHVAVERDGGSLRVVASGETGEEGFDLWAAPEALGPLWEDLLRAGATPVGEDAREVLRVEAGVIRYGRDVDASTLFLEASLDQAHSLTKGCYIGQEVVARITYRGHVNRKVVGLALAEARRPAPGTPVLVQGREVGRVTSAVVSPALGHGLALAFLRREHWEPGTLVQVGGPDAGERWSAEVRALPFYRRRA